MNRTEMEEQKKRSVEAYLAIEGIYDDVCNGRVSDDLLQEMVYLQALVNRTVYKLNERNNNEKNS